jgi:bifunctional NMN adenylyltransferase/nudix hydrolase
MTTFADKFTPKHRHSHYDYAVFIGRFQPPHRAHIDIIKQALKIAETVIVVLGSNRSAPNIQNPWTAEEREEMIRSCFSDRENGCGNYGYKKPTLRFVAVKDHHYNDNVWIAEAQTKIRDVVGDSKSVVLVGADKDKTSRYLKWFPQWELKLFPVQKWTTNIDTREISSTRIRELYFTQQEADKREEPGLDNFLIMAGVLNQPVYDELKRQWIEGKYSPLDRTPKYRRLEAEYEYYQKYMEPYKDLPFLPTFTTTDVVIVKSGHVLLVRRRVPPGENLLALPGGFLNPGEWLKDSAFREVKEETRIGVSQKVLKEHIKDKEVFDYPDRSLRGRTITYAYYVRLPDEGELPKVKGGDDAKAALWLPIGDLALHENEMFEDHLDIIQHFINR